MRLILLLTLLLSTHWAKGQSLSLDDILMARTMDSSSLRTFASEKGFELKEIDMDAWRSVHKYYSTSDNSLWFEKTFPTGRTLFSEKKTTEDNSMVYYHFTGEESQNEFRVKIKEKGFKLKRTDSKDYGGITFTHNIFVSKGFEIDIASEVFKGQQATYTLMYYRRMN